MSSIHKNLAAGGWQKLSLVEQMGNIGSEVHRVIRGDKESREKAISRALELIDLTIADPRWSSRLTELTRLREIFCDLFMGENTYHILPQELENYFLFFALASRG